MESITIGERSYLFAVRIVKLHRYLVNKSVSRIAENILNSGTAISSHVEIAFSGSSNRECIDKLELAYKEAKECWFWLKLLGDTEYLSKQLEKELLDDLSNIMKMIQSISGTMKRRTEKSIVKVVR